MANNFSNDTNCKALWRFESGALTTDSKGTNTLTDGNTVGTDTVNFKQGTASADFEATNSEYFSILDSALDAGFPLKNGDTNKKFSVCVWIKSESFPVSGDDWEIFSKVQWNDNKKSTQIGIYNNAGNTVIFFSIGWDTGLSSEAKFHTAPLSLNTWYHVTCSYDNTDKSFAIRVKDEFGGPVGTDETSTFTLDANGINIEDALLSIGCAFLTSTTRINYFDGLMDEMAVFNDVITATEATQIAKGSYGLIPRFMYHYQHNIGSGV